MASGKLASGKLASGALARGGTAGDAHPARDISLSGFEHVDRVPDMAAYVRALEDFDAQLELQQLKRIAIERTDVRAGRRVLDMGCGFGLETFRLAQIVAPGGAVVGIDRSAAFLAEAERRAAGHGLPVEFLQGDAERLPFPADSFDIGRAERLLIYLESPETALAELRRVVRPDGAIALIEPDFETNTINLDDRALLRRVLNHECDHGVRQGWLGRKLKTMLEDLSFRDIRIETRLVIFKPSLAAAYFSQLGRNAFSAGVIDEAELAGWTDGIAQREARGQLFCTIGYYLFTARR